MRQLSARSADCSRLDANGTRPISAGPSTMPARISPITLGCRSFTNRYPSNWARATRSRRMKRTEVKSEFGTAHSHSLGCISCKRCWKIQRLNRSLNRTLVSQQSQVKKRNSWTRSLLTGTLFLIPLRRFPALLPVVVCYTDRCSNRSGRVVRRGCRTRRSRHRGTRRCGRRCARSRRDGR
jgi:hypothetical protein